MMKTVLLVLFGSLLAMVGASTQHTGALAPSPIHAAGLAVVVGSLAAWWIAIRDKTASEGPRSPASRHHDVLKQVGNFDVLTRNRKELDRKLHKLRMDGKDKLQVVADFDMTLTAFKLPDGSRGMSTHGILERSGYLGEEFTTRAKEIFNKYYPIEIDPNVDAKTKWAKMSEWWETTHALILAQGVQRKDISGAVKSGQFAFREGVQELMDSLDAKEVPLLVFSAGIYDVLEECFKQKTGLYPNLNIISNKMRFDENDKLVGFEGNTIHIMNKGAVALKGTPHYEKVNQVTILCWKGALHLAPKPSLKFARQVRSRKNVILLGDSLGDLRMADGLDEKETVLKVGFLNDKIQERKEEYLDSFDLLIVNDGPMTLVNEVLHPVLAQ